MSLWRHALLFEKYGRMTLTLAEVAEQVGISEKTIKNRRVDGEFQWLKVDGRALTADVADVAAYLEQRRTSREATPA